jgi:nitrogen fixation protein NifU and related proteins
LHLTGSDRFMFDELNELYQEVILDHSKSPRNFRGLEDANRSAEGNNPVCGDRFTIFLKLENDVIRDISFQGSGCAISKAAASIMTETIKGKTIDEAQNFFQQYQRLVKTGDAEEVESTKLSVFSGVHKFPMRVKCAVLAWHALMAALKGDQKMVSTEKN